MRVNPEDPSRVLPLMCRRNSCVYCAPIKGWEVGAAIAFARPDQFVTFTLTPSTWDETQHTLTIMRQRLQRPRRGFRFEWAYSREQGRFGGFHVHAWVHGDRVPSPGDWAAEADISHLGWPHVAEITPARSLYYGHKMLVDSAELPMDAAQASIDQFLELNGGRLVHTSAGFWRDGNGRRLGTRDLAVKLALERDLDQPQWVITTEKNLAETQAWLRRGQ